MMYRLKHYQGLLNLGKFTRIEKCEEEEYKITPRKVSGGAAAKAVSEIVYKYLIRFYTPEGYGGMSSSIEYDTLEKRDEDFEIISSLVCQNKTQNFDIIREQQIISDNYEKLNQQAKEMAEVVEHVKTFMDKIKIKLK